MSRRMRFINFILAAAALLQTLVCSASAATGNVTGYDQESKALTIGIAPTDDEDGDFITSFPKIVVKDGKMQADKKYRGKMKAVITSYVKELEEEIKTAKTDRIFITHSGCEDTLIQEIYQYLEKLERFDEILVTRAGAVVSSHCGPGTLGVLFIQ